MTLPTTPSSPSSTPPSSPTLPTSPKELPRGRIKATPEDFVVEEIASYAASGEGDHVFVTFTKRDITTDAALRTFARALDVDPRSCGAAGLKDKVAVTTQTISLQTPTGVKAADLEARARTLEIPGITVLEARRHTNKLKPGHLTGNRFDIAIRGIDPARLDEVTGALDRAARDGIPNAFGTQRFGRGGDNAARALAWLRGENRGPRDARARRFMWSSLQSAVFNAVLDARVADGTWTTPLLGDWLKLEASGGMFLCADIEADRPRALAGEISPTGPMVGVKMRACEGAPGELEKRVAEQVLGADFPYEATRKLGEGTRRPLRLWIEDLRYRVATATEEQKEQGATLRVQFVLPKGAYATAVLMHAICVDETSTDPAASEVVDQGDEDGES